MNNLTTAETMRMIYKSLLFTFCAVNLSTKWHSQYAIREVELSLSQMLFSSSKGMYTNKTGRNQAKIFRKVQLHFLYS